MAAVPTDPWTAGFMALGSVAQAASQPGGPSSVLSNNAFDNSGFVVNVGSGSASAQVDKTAPATAAQAFHQAATGIGSLAANPVVLIGVGLALFLYLKHK